MNPYTVNEDAVAHARRLIASGQIVAESNWTQAKPSAQFEDTFIADHGWAAFGEWFLGLADEHRADSKAHYGFLFGDFSRLHRQALVACEQRAAEWGHEAIASSARRLLEEVDNARSSPQ